MNKYNKSYIRNKKRYRGEKYLNFRKVLKYSKSGSNDVKYLNLNNNKFKEEDLKDYDKKYIFKVPKDFEYKKILNKTNLDGVDIYKNFNSKEYFITT